MLNKRFTRNDLIFPKTENTASTYPTTFKKGGGRNMLFLRYSKCVLGMKIRYKIT